jgi:hypothetical protein
MIEASSMNLTHGDPPNQWRWKFFLPMASLWDFTVEVGACASQVVGYVALAFWIHVCDGGGLAKIFEVAGKLSCRLWCARLGHRGSTTFCFHFRCPLCKKGKNYG